MEDGEYVRARHLCPHLFAVACASDAMILVGAHMKLGVFAALMSERVACPTLLSEHVACPTLVLVCVHTCMRRSPCE